MALNINNSKVLFISANSFPPTAGDSLYSYGIIKELSIDNDLTVLSLSSLEAKGYEADFNCRWIHCQERFNRWKHLVRYLKNGSLSIIGPVQIGKDILSAEWDYVVVDHLRSYGMISNQLKNLKYLELVYLAHNVEYMNRIQKISFGESAREKLLEYLNWAIFFQEKRLIRRATKVFALSEYDAYIFRNRFLKKEIGIQFPIYPFEAKSKRNQGNGILLIGSLEWFPNRLGVEDFLSSLAEEVLEKREVYIVGKLPRGFNVKWDKANINFLGFIEDLESIYQRCEFLVVPNKYGTGIKMKVLDGIQNGLKVLAVKEAALGYSSSTKNLIVFSSINEINEFLLK